MGGSRFLALWIVTAFLSRFLQPSLSTFDASASVLGLLGAIVAVDPLAVTFIEVYPLPAFVTAGVLLFLHYVFSQQVNVAALLLGMVFGYVFVLLKPKPALPPATPRYARKF